MRILKFYAFPLFQSLFSILQKIINEKAEGIFIATMFTTQASFPKIMKLKITKPPVKLTATYKYLYLLDSNNVKPNLSKNATFSNCYLAVPRQTLGHF